MLRWRSPGLLVYVPSSLSFWKVCLPSSKPWSRPWVDIKADPCGYKGKKVLLLQPANCWSVPVQLWGAARRGKGGEGVETKMLQQPGEGESRLGLTSPWGWSGSLDDEEVGELDQERVLRASSGIPARICWASMDAWESRSPPEWLRGVFAKEVPRPDQIYHRNTQISSLKVPSGEERPQEGRGGWWTPGRHLMGSTWLQRTSFWIVILFHFTMQ